MVCFFIILFLFESSYIHSTSYIDGERVKKSTLTLIEVFAGKLFIGNFFLSLLRRTSRSEHTKSIFCASPSPMFFTTNLLQVLVIHNSPIIIASLGISKYVL